MSEGEEESVEFIELEGETEVTEPEVYAANLIEWAIDRRASDLFFSDTEKSVIVAVRRMGKVEQVRRLARELGRRGHQLQVLSSAPSSRLKRNPASPEAPAQLIRDATFVLTKYPDAHMLLTSTTIDAYGRANMMALHEAVNERDLLQQMLAGKGTGGETFGVIPVHLLQHEVGKRDLSAFIVTENMHERKKVMFMNSDAIVVLPGGAGSLDEFFEVLTWAQLGLHGKPIVVMRLTDDTDFGIVGLPAASVGFTLALVLLGGLAMAIQGRLQRRFQVC